MVIAESHMVNRPVVESDRIESLDVLRGFSLLGILLLNIIGFGFVAAAYTAPGLLIEDSNDLFAWALIELTAEGSMRGIFSILFGAGVILFLGNRREGRGWLHAKRTTWLLLFGLFNGYILLWTGDILVTYALAGFALYFFRNLEGRTLLRLAVGLTVLITLYNTGIHFGLKYLSANVETAIATQAAGQPVPQDVADLADQWNAFESEYAPTTEAIAQEISARGESYHSAFLWTAKHNTVILKGSLWSFLLPDALVMMILGMALFKLGVLQGQLARDRYAKMAIVGFTMGFSINGFEIWFAHQSQFDLIDAFLKLAPTYHLGRMAVTLGWIGLLLWLIKGGWQSSRLVAVGRMALTNYLMQSLICMLVFTGAGFGWVAQTSLWQVYGIVLPIWLLQLWLSPWWLARFYYGPVEWLWRAMTYGAVPTLRRSN
jgi:uncharacterized protein|tara:strand:- start:797 stop:2089 length:1293 start_codon:yes stop_codon:yes gene_type:complete